jgi:hypothetical protein
MSEIAWRCSHAVVDGALDALLPQASQDERAPLHEAMRYAVLSGGKRLRSQLALEAASVVAGEKFKAESALPAACAIELIHAIRWCTTTCPRWTTPTCGVASRVAIASSVKPSPFWRAMHC